MILYGYRINFDALLARIVYRWWAPLLLLLISALLLIALATDTIPRFWQEPADLRVIADSATVISVDGREWPRPIYAGRHTISATASDGRSAWADIQLRSGEVLTITMPHGLAPPQVRPIPPAAPGMQIDSVWPVASGWRATYLPQPPDTPGIPTPTIGGGQTIAINAWSMERLTTIDAYAGRADQLSVGEQIFEAIYRPSQRQLEDEGILEIRGWQPVPLQIPLTQAPNLVRFAPDGTTLLISEPIAGGEQVSAITPDDRVPLVAVPGRAVRLTWQPQGDGVVVHSIADQRLSLTLVRLRSSIAVVTIAEYPADTAAGALVPLTWRDNTLLWVAPDDRGVSLL
ncbi:MAG TPA: hypothetical protein PKC19_03165 [Roseiflexaceae bacterium]|nr:hypothetical protein [Roseiflexaceae bacterium]